MERTELSEATLTAGRGVVRATVELLPGDAGPPHMQPGDGVPQLVKGSVYDDAPESLMDYFARFERLMTRASRLHGAPAACGAAEAPRDGPAGAGAAAGALSRP